MSAATIALLAFDPDPKAFAQTESAMGAMNIERTADNEPPETSPVLTDGEGTVLMHMRGSILPFIRLGVANWLGGGGNSFVIRFGAAMPMDDEGRWLADVGVSIARGKHGTAGVEERGGFVQLESILDVRYVARENERIGVDLYGGFALGYGGPTTEDTAQSAALLTGSLGIGLRTRVGPNWLGVGLRLGRIQTLGQNFGFRSPRDGRPQRHTYFLGFTLSLHTTTETYRNLRNEPDIPEGW